MKVYCVWRDYYDDEWKTWGHDVEGMLLTEDDAKKAVEMLKTVGDDLYGFNQYEVEDFKTFEARFRMSKKIETFLERYS